MNIQAVAERLGLDGRLRPRYRTGILRKRFVGAREREQAAYGFEGLVDEIIYSHECGMTKPDPGIYALACGRLQVEPTRTVFLEIVGCVYIYPSKNEPGTRIRSWVRASRADLDVPVYEAVSEWLRTAWPFTSVTYAPR